MIENKIMSEFNDSYILSEIASIVRELTGYQEITPTTSLRSDTGLSGDDVSDFVELVRQRFGVDISEFDSDEFFPDEGSLSGIALIKYWLGFSSGYDRQYRELTVSDIIRAIKVKTRQ